MRKTTLFAMLLLFAFLVVQAQPDSRRTENTVDSKSRETSQPVDTINVKKIQEDLENLKGQVDGLNEGLLDPLSALAGLRKIKLSGYMQGEYLYTDRSPEQVGSGVATNRFQVRRGRLKVTYDADITQFVLQIDATGGGVVLKDAYAEFTEPFWRTFTLTVGQFKWPFGYEVLYSSGDRESPERATVVTTLLPGERDRGAKLAFAPQSGPLNFLRLEGGLFNGNNGTSNGAGNNTQDKYFDFVGRGSVSLPIEDAGLSIDLGTSIYEGTVPVFDSTGTNVLVRRDRTRFGVDAQLYCDLPISFLGGMALKGEYISAKDVAGFGASYGLSKRTDNPDVEFPGINAAGYIFYYIQNIGDKNQLFLKYDSWDPNTDSDNNRVNTLGLGWIFHWTDNLKSVLYYQMPKSEYLATGKTDDNRLTARIQVKF
jgi:hypothetical protein